MSESSVNERTIKRYEELKNDGEAAGYYLNSDMTITLPLIEGLLTNADRYSYPSCPCRLATGKKDKDIDIICPCDYRDKDLDEFGSCYCGLYVSPLVAEKKLPIKSIPERRHKKIDQSLKSTITDKNQDNCPPLAYPVWRCRVCGYLCAREEPPTVCPICKVTKDRFECFIAKE